MADYYSTCVVQPLFEKDWISEKDKNLLVSFGFDFDDILRKGKEPLVYLCTDDYHSSGFGDVEGVEVEYEEEDLFAAFRRIIRASKGKIRWISLEIAFTCSKLRSEGFGGSAYFITEKQKQVAWVSTDEWLTKQIARIEKKKK